MNNYNEIFQNDDDDSEEDSNLAVEDDEDNDMPLEQELDDAYEQYS